MKKAHAEGGVSMQANRGSVNLVDVYNTILHQGITTYKTKNSKASLPERVRTEKEDKLHRKGAVFAVRSKDDFTSAGVKGYIVTSKETLVEQADKISHFTPNVYRTFMYTDDEKRYIKGFEEKNLQQVNAFVVDIDTKKYSVQDILLTCIDDSIGPPTLIVSSERGYQVFFALEAPIFISNKNEFRSLTVAKRISDNIKSSLKSVEADIYCNNFGFFRMPNSRNVEWFDETAIYHTASLIQWSQQRDDDSGRSLFVLHTEGPTTSVMQSEWFHKLIHAVEIKGEKGQIGRNNILFTISLVCFQDGKDKSFTYDLIDQYNANLGSPLSGQEMKTVVESAYSGRYKGAKKSYVQELLALYVEGGDRIPVEFGGYRGWYKHKKVREDRKRSHYDEWEQDIVNYINAQNHTSDPFIWRTQKELCEEIGIASSTLNQLIKQSSVLLKTVEGRGCNAKTGWTTVALFMKHVMQLKKDLGQIFRQYVVAIVQGNLAYLAPVGGYPVVSQYVEKLLLSGGMSDLLVENDTG